MRWRSGWLLAALLAVAGTRPVAAKGDVVAVYRIYPDVLAATAAVEPAGEMRLLFDGHECPGFRTGKTRNQPYESDGSVRFELTGHIPDICRKPPSDARILTESGRVLQADARFDGANQTVNVISAVVIGGAVPGNPTLLAVNRVSILDWPRSEVGRLIVQAGNFRCGEADLTRITAGDAQDPVIRLDGPGVPAACSTNGTRLTLFIRYSGETDARLLLRAPAVVRNTTVLVSGLAPAPPDSMPAPPDAGSGIESNPPLEGTGSGAPSAAEVRAWEIGYSISLGAAVLAIVVIEVTFGGRRVTRNTHSAADVQA